MPLRRAVVIRWILRHLPCPAEGQQPSKERQSSHSSHRIPVHSYLVGSPNSDSNKGFSMILLSTLGSGPAGTVSLAPVVLPLCSRCAPGPAGSGSLAPVALPLCSRCAPGPAGSVSLAPVVLPLCSRFAVGGHFALVSFWPALAVPRRPGAL